MEPIELKKEIEVVDHERGGMKKTFVIFKLTQDQLDAMPEEERKTFIPVNQVEQIEKPKSKSKEIE